MLAQGGERVIVVDADLRRPTQHVLLKADRDQGLTNYLAAPGEHPDWRLYTQTVGPTNLHVLTCGPIPPSPPELLGSERFGGLVSALSDHYDWVLVDSPPAASLADAPLLASLVDMVVLVVQHNTTDRDLVIKVARRLRLVNPALVGAVLNNVNIDRNRDAYYAGYYYLSENEGKSPKKRRVANKAGVG
jgi:capsular exopolysaccharide synthesis family protein